MDTKIEVGRCCGHHMFYGIDIYRAYEYNAFTGKKEFITKHIPSFSVFEKEMFKCIDRLCSDRMGAFFSVVYAEHQNKEIPEWLEKIGFVATLTSKSWKTGFLLTHYIISYEQLMDYFGIAYEDEEEEEYNDDYDPEA